MKRLLSAVLALSLLGTTAASADSWGQGGYHGGWHGGGHYGGRYFGGAGVVALGLGILTLGILASESAHQRARYYDQDGYYGPPANGDRYGDEGGPRSDPRGAAPASPYDGNGYYNGGRDQGDDGNW